MSKSITATVPGVQLQVANDFSTTPEPVTDPTGTASPLQLSTQSVVVQGGKFGIGTDFLTGTAPSFPLHVGVGNTVRFELSNGAMLSLGGSGQFSIDAPTKPAQRFIVTDGGNVGINQPNPAYTLDVNGTINATGLHFTGQFAIPGIQPESTAPNPQNLEAVYVDTQTGILYYHD
jgi:hypothetical protein